MFNFDLFMESGIARLHDESNKKREDMVFFKYRSFENLHRFLDILINKRLYASCYRDLNDPLEGHFDWRKFDSSTNNVIFKTLYNTKICSLQVAKENDIPSDRLMWSHYADSHKGCCFKVSISSPKDWSFLPICYREIKPNISGKDIEEDVKAILSHKTKDWQYENEGRFLCTKNKASKYLKVKIEALYLGCKVKSEDKQFLAKLVNKIDPSIKIFAMKEVPTEDFYPSLIAIPYH